MQTAVPTKKSTKDAHAHAASKGLLLKATDVHNESHASAEVALLAPVLAELQPLLPQENTSNNMHAGLDTLLPGYLSRPQPSPVKTVNLHPTAAADQLVSSRALWPVDMDGAVQQQGLLKARQLRSQPVQIVDKTFPCPQPTILASGSQQLPDLITQPLHQQAAGHVVQDSHVLNELMEELSAARDSAHDQSGCVLPSSIEMTPILQHPSLGTDQQQAATASPPQVIDTNEPADAGETFPEQDQLANKKPRRKRKLDDVVVQREAVICSLPVPAVLERLMQIYHVISSAHNLYLRQHIQPTWSHVVSFMPTQSMQVWKDTCIDILFAGLCDCCAALMYKPPWEL